MNSTRTSRPLCLSLSLALFMLVGACSEGEEGDPKMSGASASERSDSAHHDDASEQAPEGDASSTWSDATSSERSSDAEGAPPQGNDSSPAPRADTTLESPDDEESGPIEGVEIQEFGSVSLNPETGLSEALTLEVPDDAVSLSISVVGAPGLYYAVDELDAPSGQKLVPTAWYSSPDNAGGYQVCLPCLNRISASSGAHATLVPMSQDVSVEGGTYTFQLVSFEVVIGQFWEPPDFDFQGGEVQVTAIIKRAEGGLPAAGRLNLNLHFTGAGGLSAATAPSAPEMVEALATFTDIYAQVGIEVGEITYRDIDEAYRTVDGIMGPDADFEAAAAETAGAPPGVNFIFVDEIVDSSNPLGGFGVILGVSGGIPGPIGMQGSARSAVIVDVTPPEMAGDVPFGVTMAHEMGHFLGLFHSSEMPFVNLHDPIDDTGENDVDNLMFFEASNGGTTLSAGQGAVMRANPWVSHPTGVTP